MSKRLGGIEAGGTSFAVSWSFDDPTQVQQQCVIKTTTPEETISQVAKLLASWGVDAVGIASFGPIDLKKDSPTYGYITSTPKPLWGNVDLLGQIRSKMKEYGHQADIPFEFDTDVNGAALAEILYGDHFDNQQCDTRCNTEEKDDFKFTIPEKSLCYITVGTGIGVGVYVEGTAVKGLLHPEAGHILVRRHEKDTYKGNCPYHGDCLEGLANAQAVAARLQIQPSELSTVSPTHEIWDIIGYYLAQLCVSLTLITSPHVIILGGGVVKTEAVIASTRKYTLQLLNGYIQASNGAVTTPEGITRYITTSRFNTPNSITTSGSIGALCLAKIALEKGCKN